VPDIKKLGTTLAFHLGFPDSNLFLKSGYLDCGLSWFSSVPPKYPDSSSNCATTMNFHALSTYILIIERDASYKLGHFKLPM